jgi:hypothetical protein
MGTDDVELRRLRFSQRFVEESSVLGCDVALAPEKFVTFRKNRSAFNFRLKQYTMNLFLSFALERNG